MLVKMADEKRPGTEPAIVFTTSQVSDEPKKSCVSKKSVLIAVISLLITGLVVTAVLVGIRLVTDSNVEMLKYSMKANGVSQNVTTDSNNVVTYHVTKGSVEAWIVQDFDKDIQATKVISDGEAACYVTALNRSTSPDASAIVEPTGINSAPRQSITYKVSPQQIPDLTYLGKKISSMCQNIPTYHAVPDCGASSTDNSGFSYSNSSSSVDHRSKRTPAFCATCTANNCPNCICACGCCAIVCGQFASSQYIITLRNGVWYCTYYMYKVCGAASLATSSLNTTCRFNERYYNP